MEQRGKLAQISRAKTWGLGLLSVILLVLSFPNFEFSILVWVALVPLLIALANQPSKRQAFLLGWFVGATFFFATCYWLTYSMIHYGGLPAWLSYPLIFIGAAVLGLFPGIFALLLAGSIRALGLKALIAAPFLWAALEWARLSVTGQLWNAIGYSLAFHPSLIRVAQWGGVYAVGFMIVTANAAIAFAILKRTFKAVVISSLTIVAIVGVTIGVKLYVDLNGAITRSDSAHITVIALQPNVPMEIDKSEQEFADLLNRHIEKSAEALEQTTDDGRTRLLIWPESPMNFTYGSDPQLRERLARFVKEHHVYLLLNSQEVSGDSFLNSALLINPEGDLVAQYDKIRLMPFGEYVPLPSWVPGADRVRGIVGEFVPGNRYQLMIADHTRLATFICIESAYPWIARNLTAAGAEALVNISNDGYLGPTAVMRQHLANAIFRAVENDRPLLRVTNTGITAHISNRGEVLDATPGFQTVTRIWKLYPETSGQTFYTRHGDWFVGLCGVVSLVFLALSLKRFRESSSGEREAQLS
jgi:apolipoprotein N-acyltransferase